MIQLFSISVASKFLYISQGTLFHNPHAIVPYNYLSCAARFTIKEGILVNLFLLAGKKSNYSRKDELSTFYDQCLSGNILFYQSLFTCIDDGCSFVYLQHQ